MDDKFINALKTSERLTEAKLDEGLGQNLKNAGATLVKAGAQAAKNAWNNSTVGKAVNKVKDLAQQFDQEKAQKAQQQQAQAQQQEQDKVNQGNQKNIKTFVDLIATYLCTQIFTKQNADENLKNVFLGFKIPQDVVDNAFNKAKQNLNNNNGQENSNKESRSLRIAKMNGTSQPLSEGKGKDNASALLQKLGKVYDSNFDLNILSEILQDKTFNAVHKNLKNDSNYKQAKAVVDIMISGQQKPQSPEQSQTQQQQQQPENKPDPQKSEEIAKKADEIPPKAGEQVNNEYWHKVWTSLSNKAGSLNGQKELQNVVNNFVTELGRIVNK